MTNNDQSAPLLFWRDYRCKNPKCRRVIGETNGILLEVGGWTHETAATGKCKCGLVQTWRPVAVKKQETLDVTHKGAILESIPA